MKDDSLAARGFILNRFPPLPASAWRSKVSLSGREEEILLTMSKSFSLFIVQAC